MLSIGGRTLAAHLANVQRSHSAHHLSTSLLIPGQKHRWRTNCRVRLWPWCPISSWHALSTSSLITDGRISWWISMWSSLKIIRCSRSLITRSFAQCFRHLWTSSGSFRQAAFDSGTPCSCISRSLATVGSLIWSMTRSADWNAGKVAVVDTSPSLPRSASRLTICCSTRIVSFPPQDTKSSGSAVVCAMRLHVAATCCSDCRSTSLGSLDNPSAATFDFPDRYTTSKSKDASELTHLCSIAPSLDEFR